MVAKTPIQQRRFREMAYCFACFFSAAQIYMCGRISYLGASSLCRQPTPPGSPPSQSLISTHHHLGLGPREPPRPPPSPLPPGWPPPPSFLIPAPPPSHCDRASCALLSTRAFAEDRFPSLCEFGRVHSQAFSPSAGFFLAFDIARFFRSNMQRSWLAGCIFDIFSRGVSLSKRPSVQSFFFFPLLPPA